MAVATDLSDCLGYMIINNNTGSIVKVPFDKMIVFYISFAVQVEGNLTNVDRIAQAVSRIVLLGNSDSILNTGEKFNSIVVNYPKFYYVITRSDQQIYVIKRQSF